MEFSWILQMLQQVFPAWGPASIHGIYMEELLYLKSQTKYYMECEITYIYNNYALQLPWSFRMCSYAWAIEDNRSNWGLNSSAWKCGREPADPWAEQLI